MIRHNETINYPAELDPLEREYNELEAKLKALAEQYDKLTVEEEWRQLGDFLAGKWILTRDNELYWCESSSPSQSHYLRHITPSSAAKGICYYDAPVMGKLIINGIKIYWDKEQNALATKYLKQEEIIVRYSNYLIDENSAKKRIEAILKSHVDIYSYHTYIGDLRLDLDVKLNFDIKHVDEKDKDIHII